jgi:hypothetical protein
MGGLSTDFENEDEGDTIDGQFHLGGAALLADVYPTQNGWRVSGGLFISNTDLSATGTVNTGVDPDPSASVKANFENEIAPMITTGYDFAFGNGWAFTTEIGAILIGGVDVSYTASDPADQAEIDADPDVQEAIADAADLNAYPYLSLGLSFKF